MLTLGAVIFIAVKPILKIYLILAVGFLLVKFNMLTMETSRGISNMVVNALAPSLIFNKIVTNLSGSQIKEIGVIVLSTVVIFGTGFFLALIVSLITPVPQKWRWGLLFAGLFSNIGDLPVAYLQSMGTGIVFTEAEADKGVALSCVFSAGMNFMMMNLGMFQIVGLDFREKKEDREQSPESSDNSIFMSKNIPLEGPSNDTRRRPSVVSEAIAEDDEEDNERRSETLSPSQTGSSTNPEFNVVPLVTNSDDTDSTNEAESQSTQQSRRISNDRLSLPKRVHTTQLSHYGNDSFSLRRRRRSSAASGSFSRIRSTDSGYSTRAFRSKTQNIESLINEYSEAERIKTISGMTNLARNISKTQEVGLNLANEDEDDDLATDNEVTPTDASTKPLISKWNKFIEKYNLAWFEFMLINFKRVPSVSLLLALAVAMIPWVRALFVHNSIDIPDAPDELPPLNFLMDFTEYLGNAQVPMGLLLLGGTLARMEIDQIPKGYWKTVLGMVIVRLVIMPIIGVLYTDRLYGAGWLDDDISRFLMIVSWSLPSATSQVYFTAFYTPLEGEHVQLDCLALFLLTQYPILVISLPFVVSYALKVDIGM